MYPCNPVYRPRWVLPLVFIIFSIAKDPVEYPMLHLAVIILWLLWSWNTSQSFLDFDESHLDTVEYCQKFCTRWYARADSHWIMRTDCSVSINFAGRLRSCWNGPHESPHIMSPWPGMNPATLAASCVDSLLISSQTWYYKPGCHGCSLAQSCPILLKFDNQCW